MNYHLSDDDSDSEALSSLDDDDFEMGGSSDFVSSEGKYYHLDTATEKYLNDGTGRMSGQTRQKRITGVDVSKVSLTPACPVTDGNCKTVSIGDHGVFNLKSMDDVCRGQVIFLNISKALNSVDRSSVYHSPVDSLCYVHNGNYRLWVQTKNGRLDLCNAVDEISS